MKRRIEEKNLSKLDAFFGEEWSNNKHSPLTHGNIIIIPSGRPLIPRKRPLDNASGLLVFPNTLQESTSAEASSLHQRSFLP